MGFSKTTIRYTKSKTIDKELEQKIAESVEGSKEMRQQMRKVFDAANKRIKRLQSSKSVLSPALEALEDVHFGIGNFKSNTGSDWESLKKEYATAVAFMRSPTSTLLGAKEFTRDVRRATKIPDFIWDGYTNDKGEWVEGIGETIIKGSRLVLSEVGSRMPYKEVIQAAFDTAIEDSKGEMEKWLRKIAEELQEDIDQTSAKLANTISSGLDDIFEYWTKI